MLFPFSISFSFLLEKKKVWAEKLSLNIEYIPGSQSAHSLRSKQETIDPLQEMTLWEGKVDARVSLAFPEFPSELTSGCQTISSFPTKTVPAGSSVHPRMPPREPGQWARTLSRHFYALFNITANLYQSVAGEGGTKIIFTSSPNGHPSLRHPLMDYPHGQSSSTPGPSPSSTPPIGTKAKHGSLAPLLEIP